MNALNAASETVLSSCLGSCNWAVCCTTLHFRLSVTQSNRIVMGQLTLPRVTTMMSRDALDVCLCCIRLTCGCTCANPLCAAATHACGTLAHKANSVELPRPNPHSCTLVSLCLSPVHAQDCTAQQHTQQQQHTTGSPLSTPRTRSQVVRRHDALAVGASNCCLDFRDTASLSVVLDQQLCNVLPATQQSHLCVQGCGRIVAAK